MRRNPELPPSVAALCQRFPSHPAPSVAGLRGTELVPALAGPVVRVQAREWSVEYDQLTVTVWISSELADYKLLSPARDYAFLWNRLQHKTVRSHLALSSDPRRLCRPH